MPEQIQKVLNQIVEWWKKFNTKQKIVLGSITGAILLALVILALVVSTPVMVELVRCETTADASKVKEMLESDGSIEYELSQDGLTFLVNEKHEIAANFLLADNGIPSSGYGIENVFEGGFSSTEADKTKRYERYLEEHFAEHLATLANVETATVDLDIPNDDGTILAREQEAFAAVILTLSGEMTEEQSAGVAQFIATQIGNKSTDNILILDSESNVLFSGGDSNTVMGTASSQLSLQEKKENLIKSEIKDVLVGGSLYDHVEIALNLNVDFDIKRETSRKFSAPDGQTNGMIGEQSTYESNSVGGAAATPGTDPNDDTTYMLEDNEYTESNVTDQTTVYQNDETVTDIQSSPGKVNVEDSSIAIVAKNYVVYDEDTLRESGALADMSFQEYIAANSAPIRMDVDEDYYTMIANATGFPVESISIIAYTEPMFQYSTGGRTFSDYLQIALTVIILLLLGFVVFRGTRKDKEAEYEEELSVESLLESTRENQDQMADIGYNEKSETRLLIEKFVEENPEAAASLLRNWLNEEWE